MEELYRLMQKKNLTTLEAIFEFCHSRKITEILDISAKAFIVTIKEYTPAKSGSLFNFSASVALSGGNYPCESPDCRIKEVAELGKFSAVYSDSTTIYNPFDFIYYFLDSEHETDMSEAEIRLNALNALWITFEFKPLIERGIIKFSKTVFGICKNCKKKKDKITDSIYENFDVIAKKQLVPLLREIGVEYGKGFIHFTGTEQLIGEDMYIHYKEFPTSLIKDNKKIRDFSKLSYKNPFMQKFIIEAIESLMTQKMYYPENLTQTYLTNNILEKTLLEALGKQVESKALNFFANDLPIVKNMSYQNIVDMRDKYFDEFKSFQEHVSDLVSKAKTFETQIEFNDYVNTQLKKQLNDLKKIQQEGNKKIFTKGIVGGFFLGASIAISTIINNDLPSLVGILKASYDCVDVISSSNEIGGTIEKNPLFFYYKLSQSIH